MDIKSIQSAKKNTHSPKVIITGVTGQDGSHMADYLLKNYPDYVIYGAARRLSVPNHQNIKHITSDRFSLFNMDITDPHSISTSVQLLQPDYFINFAAQSFVGSSWDFPEQTWQTNCTSVLHILESIRNHKPDCKMYQAGSSEEFGNVIYSPQDEDHPPRPRSPYGASKVAARQLIKVYRESFGLYAVQGWLFNHEGRRRGEEFVTRKITKGAVRIKKEIENNKTPTPLELGNVNAKRDWGDAEDFVRAVWKMLNQKEPVKDYVVGTGEQHSIREFVEKAFSYIGIEGCWSGEGVYEKYANDMFDLVTINPTFYRPAEVDNLFANYNQIKNDLGWKPTTSFDELVKKMVDKDLEC